MERDYWLKQVEPLYPDIEWSKPETKSQKGKLLILGGSSHGFMSIAKAYTDASSYGAGEIKVVLPDMVQKMIQDKSLPIEFAASTPSGSFSLEGEDAIKGYDSWASAVYLAGEFGRNSETEMLLHNLARNSSNLLAITKDTVDYFYNDAEVLLARDKSIISCSLSQLQKIVTSINYEKAVTFEMGILDLVDLLHEISEKYESTIVTYHQGSVAVANSGFVSTTKCDEVIWQQETATKAIVYAMQHPNQIFEAVTSAVLVE